MNWIQKVEGDTAGEGGVYRNIARNITCNWEIVFGLVGPKRECRGMVGMSLDPQLGK